MGTRLNGGMDMGHMQNIATDGYAEMIAGNFDMRVYICKASPLTPTPRLCCGRDAQYPKLPLYRVSICQHDKRAVGAPS